MAVNVRKIIVVGTLGADADARFTPTGTANTSFNIASNWKDSNKNEQTTWFNVTWWGEFSHNVAPFLKKGKLVYVEGELNPREYQDKKTGNTRLSLDIKANNVQMLSKKDEVEASTPQDASPVDLEDDDVPF